MISFNDLQKRLLADPEVRVEYDVLEEEFAITAALIAARAAANLTQEQVADRMHTKQTAVARLESGRGNPSVQTLKSFAQATGTRLKISFEPMQPAN